LQLLPAGRELLSQVQPLDIFTQAEANLLQKEFKSLRHALGSTLEVLQKANNSKSFGFCKSCVYYRESDQHMQCGLTEEPLSQDEVQKICREHLFPNVKAD
jgi:MarR family transcriptional repressor of emrRAB